MMDSEINWLHLPDIIWVSILNNLEHECLLNASITCKKFNDVLSLSQRLMNRLSLTIKNPYSVYYIKNEHEKQKIILKSIWEMKLMKECLQKSERKYDSISMCSLVDRLTKKYIMNAIIDILKYFAGSVKEISFYNTSLQDDYFFKIIQTMKNLNVLKFEGDGCFLWQDKAEVIRPYIVSSINEISIKRVGGFIFQNLHMFDNLTTLEVDDFGTQYETDLETFESFLLMQKKLKVLHLRNMLFKSDKLSNNIKFSLDELSLRGVHWTNNENSIKFFKTQTNLKKISLENFKLDKIEHNELLTHLFGNNLQLKTVDLSTSKIFNNNNKGGFNLKNFSFLRVNSSVENLILSLDESQNATKCLTVFSKLFPNVNNFTYAMNNKVDHGLDLIHNWKYLESVHCQLYDINQFFENVNIAEKLTTCTIRRFDPDDIRIPQLKKFLNRHQNIKHMTLNPTYCTICDEMPIADEILSLILNTLKSLKTLIWNENKCFLSKNLK